MSIEEKKKFLKQYKKLIYKIKTLDDELECLRMDELPGGIDYSKDKVQTSPTNDSMINHVIRIDDITRDIERCREDAKKRCKEIIKAIDTLDDDMHQVVMHRRYILLESWETISYNIHYSTQRLYEIHGEALAEIKIENIRENQSNHI